MSPTCAGDKAVHSAQVTEPSGATSVCSVCHLLSSSRGHPQHTCTAGH